MHTDPGDIRDARRASKETGNGFGKELVRDSRLKLEGKLAGNLCQQVRW